jgi:hypothetical protein
MSMVGWKYTADTLFVRFLHSKIQYSPLWPTGNPLTALFEFIQHSFVPSENVGVRR